jgi:hypothetical protein
MSSHWELKSTFSRTLSHPLQSSPSFIEYDIPDKISSAASDCSEQRQKLHIISYVEGKGSNALLHIQLYRYWFMRFIPRFLRPKPIAKTGIRPYSTRKPLMDEIIRNKFSEVSGKIFFRILHTILSYSHCRLSRFDTSSNICLYVGYTNLEKFRTWRQAPWFSL